MLGRMKTIASRVALFFVALFRVALKELHAWRHTVGEPLRLQDTHAPLLQDLQHDAGMQFHTD